MQYCRLYLIFYFAGQFINSTAYSQGTLETCQNAFLFESEEYAVVDTILICKNACEVPTGYTTNLNMAVCSDGLCARLILKMYWDLAGTYMGYDTITGNPLTKFDHKPFTGADYKRLDEILREKNSILGTMEQEELLDKRVKIKSTTVDAVTAATSQLVKKSVVEGAVYSTYALWHLIYGSIIDSMRSYTMDIYSIQVAKLLLNSNNYDSQLFILKHMSEEDYKATFPTLIEAVKRSVPFIRTYIIGKVPLPCETEGKNQEFASIFPELDSNSKSAFIDRITANEDVAAIFLPLLTPYSKLLNSRQLDKCISAFQKFEIAIPKEFKKT